MERTYKIGQAVTYVDEVGVRHPALVKCWWVQWPEGLLEKYPDRPHHPDIPAEAIAYHKELTKAEPGCNLVFVSADGARNDTCGRQTEIKTSVVHKGSQVAPGLFWCWPDE